MTFCRGVTTAVPYTQECRFGTLHSVGRFLTWGRFCRFWSNPLVYVKYVLKAYCGDQILTKSLSSPLFLYFVVQSVSSFDRKTIGMWWTGRDMEGSSRGLIEPFSRNLLGETENTKENLRISGLDANWALRTQVCSVTATITRSLCVDDTYVRS